MWSCHTGGADGSGNGPLGSVVGEGSESTVLHEWAMALGTPAGGADESESKMSGFGCSALWFWWEWWQEGCQPGGGAAPPH